MTKKNGDAMGANFSCHSVGIFCIALSFRRNLLRPFVHPLCHSVGNAQRIPTE
jgi:hypothetical protein